MNCRQKIIQLLENKSGIEALGKIFHTKNNSYFYDAGTGNVLKLETDLEKYFFDRLFDKEDSNNRDFLKGIRDGMYDRTLSELDEINALQNGQAQYLYSIQHANIEEQLEHHLSQLILELTEKCNLRCKYCIYNDSFDFNRNFGVNDMTDEVAIDAIDFAFNHSQGDLAITFYGGEPFLNFPLLRKCIDYAKQKAMMLDREIHFSLTSNLTLVKKEYADYLSTIPNISILCSIDGPQTIHDNCRVYPNGRGSFLDAIEGFKRLQAVFDENKGQVLSINGVFTPPYTIQRIEEISDFYNSLGLSDSSNCLLTYPTEGSINDYEEIIKMKSCADFYDCQNNFIDPLALWRKREFSECRAMPENKLGQNATLIQLHSIHTRPILSEPHDSCLPFNGCCPPGVRRLYVSTIGEFKVCERVGNAPSIGNIMSGYDIDSIKKNYIDNYNNESIDDCRICWANLLCRVCYAACYNQNGLDIESKKRVCVSERNLVRQQLELYHEILEENPSLIDSLNDMKVV